MNKRQAIFAKTGGKCWYCGCDLPEKGWHADHIEPIHRHFWKNTNDCDYPHRENEENKVPSCASCNIQKGSLSVEGFRRKIEGFIHSLNQYHTQYAVAKRYGLLSETNTRVVFWFETVNGEETNTVSE